MTQPRRMLFSSFKATNVTILTLSLLSYLDLGLVCLKFFRYFQYIPVKRFNIFVQSTVNALRQRDKNHNPSVVAERCWQTACMVNNFLIPVAIQSLCI